MSERARITVVPVDWNTQSAPPREVRRSVFIEEQRVPEELEWDEADQVSRHVVAFSEQGEPIGTGRLLPDGHIGRMAVLARWRRRGVGSALLRALLRLAIDAQQTMVRVHAQTHAVRFYEKHGFAVEGAEFMEAGIAHIAMTRSLVRAAADEQRDA